MKTVVLFLSLVAFVAVVFGLWQLQPKPITVLSEKSLNPTPAQTPQDQTLEPKDGSIVKSKTVTFKGKMLAGSTIFIVSNDFQTSAQADANGAFQKDITLTPGLNLIDVISISADLSKDTRKSLSLYLAQDGSSGVVAAGSVKTIFDNVITLTTLNSQANIKVAPSTSITFPKDVTPDASPSSSVADIRVGDYAVALGNTANTGTLTAQKLTIIRDNKPQNNEEYIAVKVLTAPKQNIFTAKSVKDSKILELTVDKNTQISDSGKDTKVDAITKDKNAVIIYHTETGKKVVDLIYLLP
ncbi:MAG: hypothetical protein Q7S45_00885 [Candidatus Curtissbacteria bacterium]|nr:hypothetical protein [Candidatus Curtissbacteria bacterium]